MSTIKTSMLTAAAVATFFVASAFAATAFAVPVSGNAPYFDDATTMSQLQRSDVQSQAATDLPTAGEFSAQAEQAQVTTNRSRADVESSVHEMPAAGEAA